MIKISTISRLIASALAVLLGLTACSTMPGQSTPKVTTADGPPPFPVDVSQLKDAVPKYEAINAYDNPPFYTIHGKQYYVMSSAKGYSKVGVASWYGTKFHGKPTSSREPYNMLAMTAASPTLPIPTYVRVTNLENGRKVIVKVNDRGPFADNRIMDLSYAAAKKLGYAEKGTAKVKVEAITFDSPSQPGIVYAENTQQSLPAHIKPAHTKQVYVQVGAFYQMAKAEQLQSRVAQLTHQETRIEPMVSSDKTLYRVQVGPLQDLQKSNVMDKLQQQGFSNTITVLS